MRISQRISSIPPSPTLAVTQRARELKAEGVDIISFGAGEPDFATPAPICDAAERAMRAGKTHYTAVGGVDELKEAIADYNEAKLGVRFEKNEIIASCGAKHSLYNLFLSLLDPGDEVIIPAPYWVSYPTQVEIAGGKPIHVLGTPENGFVPSLDALEQATSDRTRAIVINNPTNPTGAFWSADQLEGIAGWLQKHPQIVVISDAIYDELVYDGAEYTELLELSPTLRDRYVLINGVSKAFAMTGWRLGYALAPAPLVKAMQTLQSQSTSNPCSITQFAAAEALRLGQDAIGPMRDAFEARRNLIFDLLTAIDDVAVAKPRGAFYIFPDVSAFIGRRTPDGETIEDDMGLASYLLEAGPVAVVPGSAFGSPGFVRMSYASATEQIEEGVKRLGAALGRLE